MTKHEMTNDEIMTKHERTPRPLLPSSFVIRHSSFRRRQVVEVVIFWLFRVATYLVLAAATYIFLDIGIKGSRTLFTTHAPFINVPFFTQGPQTLFVFDYEGKKYTLSDR
ncbi:MAG: hypothetical protein DMF15_13125, partial [Verrucomicrobia bacterium]